ncbi:hypothetical protein H2248_002406 [Termitomyces sp. 'cryptogamus']|nr:hypothetical protein H2248_002406 [Termitomyces sp. 'cryptogamus']
MIWKTQWKLPKVLYLLTRVVPLVTLMMLLSFNSIHPGFGSGFLTWGSYIIFFLVDMIFLVRTWVIWGKSRRLLIFLSIFGLAILGALLGLLSLSKKVSNVLFENYHVQLARCLLFAVYSTVELCLVSFKALQFSRSKRLLGKRMPLQTVMHYDGISSAPMLSTDSDMFILISRHSLFFICSHHIGVYPYRCRSISGN